jgi:hypothetical protein
MKSSWKLDKMLERARKEEPFIPLEAADRFLRLHQINRSTPISWFAGMRTYALAGAASVVFLVFLYFGVLKTPAPEIPVPQSVAQAPQVVKPTTPAVSSLAEGLATGRARSHREPASKTGVHDVTGTVPATSLSFPPSSPVSWSPDIINPLRLYMLDSLELVKIGIMTFNDGSIGFAASSRIEKDIDGVTLVSYGSRLTDPRSQGNHDPVPAIRKHTDVENTAWLKLRDDMAKRKLNINCVMQTDCDGNKIMKSIGRDYFLPDLSRASGASRTDRHIDFCADNIDPRLQHLIPILVQTKATTRIFWMDPLPDLLMNLPDAIQTEIREQEKRERARKNLDARFHNPNGVLFTVQSGASPETNPSVELHLDHERELSIALYDIWGNRVMELVPLQCFSQGVWKQEFDVRELSKGIYLFAVVSGDGDHMVQRMCVP